MNKLFHQLDRVLILLVILLGLGSNTILAVDIIQPPGVNLPNYNRARISAKATLEGNAVIARASGPAAAWYNPAGLRPIASLDGSANLYEIVDAQVTGLGTTSSSRELVQIPSFIGASDPVTEGGMSAYALVVAAPDAWTQRFTLDNTFVDGDTYDSINLTTNQNVRSFAPGAAFATEVSDNWHVGIGAWGFYSASDRTTINRQTNVDLSTPTGTTVLSTTDSRIQTINIRMSLGLQYHDESGMRIGFTAWSPGVQIYEDGFISAQIQSSSDTTTFSAGIFDDNPNIEQKYPFELRGGFGYQYESWSWEVSASYHHGVGEYTVFKTSQEITGVARDNATGTGAVFFQPLPATVTDLETIVNIAAGANYKFGKRWTARAGFSTDFSPVKNSDDPYYTRIDLKQINFGLTRRARTDFTVGLSYTWGKQDDFPVNDISGNNLGQGSLDYSALALILGVEVAL